MNFAAERKFNISRVTSRESIRSKLPNTVLIVDNNKVSCYLLQKILRNSYSIIEASCAGEALELLEREADSICAVILDFAEPVPDCGRMLREFTIGGRYEGIPVVAVTENESQVSELRALELCTWDFVLKSYNADIIRFRVKNAILQSRLSAFSQLQYMSEHSALTGLYNRMKFFEAVRALLDRHPSERFAFIRFDIDNFKLINTFFGTAEGDALLVGIADRLRSLAAADADKTVIGHMGADDFCIFMPFKTSRELERSLESAGLLFKSYKSDFELVPSIGIYIIEDNAMPVENMYDNASMAAKKCKGNYLHVIEYYKKWMGELAARETEIVGAMNQALKQRQFVVYYQPKYAVDSGKPYGAEALVRWIHPEKGIIPPSEFIPVFEKNGFISRLDFYVWETVCADIARLNAMGMPHAPVSVNVSRVNFYNSALASILISLTKRYGIDPSQLNLEITESAYNENTHQFQRTIAALRKAGFIIMMDDFGCGYSSLNTLKDLDFDILKIDMKVISSRGPSDCNDKTVKIIASTIRMSKWLGMPVIIEGVETKEQAELVTALGCDYIQGYYYAKPMPVEDYKRLLRCCADGHCARRSADDRTLYRALVCSTPEAEQFYGRIKQPMVVIEYTGRDFTAVRVNGAFRQAFDCGDSCEFLAEALFKSGYGMAVSNAITRAGESKTLATCEYYHTDSAGVKTWYRIHIRNIAGTEEKSLLLAVFYDISAEKQLELDIENLKRRLTGPPDES